MRFSKFTYFLVSSILLLAFWNLSPIVSILNKDIILVLSLALSIWGISQQKDRFSLPSNYFNKYHWIWISIFLGVAISMFNAELFWGQSISITIITQRSLYAFILLPTIIHIQPSIQDIQKAIAILSYITFSVWIISIISPNMIASISEETITNRNNNDANTDIGYYVIGIHIVALHTYILIQKYIQHFSYKRFFKALFWIGFIILYQNRSMMIGVILVFIYSLTKLKSKYKPIIIGSIFIVTLIFIVYTWYIWVALFDETQDQLANKDYARWKALHYYLYDYSPNWWCYIFGNGMPSGGNSAFGNLYLANMSNGIFTSDLGMIGTWVHFGIIPLIGIYYALIQILCKNKYPLYLKFMSFHIICVPTIFTYNNLQGVLLFTIIIYLFIHYSELPQYNRKYHLIKQYASNHNCKL